MKHTKNKNHANPKPDSLGAAPSLSAAAGRLDLPPELLTHCKGLGWKCFLPSNRVDCDAFLIELAEHPDLLEQFKCVPNHKLEQALLVRERRLDLADKRAIRSRQFLPLSEMKASCNRYVGAMKTRMESAVENIKRLAVVDAGCTAEQAQKISELLAAEHHEALLQMENGDWIK
jgi:hypothetical protein